MESSHQSEKLSISLPDERAKWVRNKVGSGAYSSNSQIVHEGLRLLQDHEEVRAKKLKSLQNMVEESLQSGPSIPAEEALAQLNQLKEARKS